MDTPLVKVAVEDDSIVIRVSINDLVFIVENDPEFNYKIVDKEKFAVMMCRALENSKSFSNNEGMNAMEELFKNAYESVYEEGCDDVMIGSDPFNIE